MQGNGGEELGQEQVQRWQQTANRVAQRLQQDEGFRQALETDPAGALQQFGISDGRVQEDIAREMGQSGLAMVQDWCIFTCSGCCLTCWWTSF